MVGAVIATDDGEEIASAYHERAGGPHAESAAIEKAGARARGATLYVSLEPCDHSGRTPPCTQAIVGAGIKRVVVAALDPDDRVQGVGVRRLRSAGLHVDVGVGEGAARDLNRMYFHQRTTGRPFVTLKMAQSLDGAIGDRPGERVALTGAAAAAHVRSLRYEHDAVMVGIETALVDDPMLTVRPYKKRAVPYVRIVVDSAGRLPLSSKVAKDVSRASTIAGVTERAPRSTLNDLGSAGVEVLTCKSDGAGRVDLTDLLARLGRRGMLGVLCEGGPTLAAALLGADLVNEVHFIIGPLIFGAASAVAAVGRLEKRVRVQIERIRSLGDDVLVVARLG